MHEVEGNTVALKIRTHVSQLGNVRLKIVLGQFLKVHFKLLLNNISSNKSLLEQKIALYSNRAIDLLDPIETSILLVASYELLFCKHIPFKVIISEALELANMFGSATSYKFINSVLDRLAKSC